MNEFTDLIKDSERYLRSATLLFHDHDYNSCVSRCYYSMSSIITALFISRNLKVSNQRGVIRLFARHFIKTGIFNRELGKTLNDAYRLKQMECYVPLSPISENEAINILEKTGNFIATVKNYLNIEDSYNSPLNMPKSHELEIGIQKITTKLKIVSQQIKQMRNETIECVFNAENDSQRQEILSKFDEYIEKENATIFEDIQSKFKDKVVVPPIIHDFKGTIDDETKRFLISAKTVEQFACEFLPENFDFSLPGSGLWKAVERELNLSFVWYLRQCYGIVENDPLIATEKLNSSVRIEIKAGRKGYVDLNKREKEKPHRFMSIMLRNIEYILRSSRGNGVDAQLQLVMDEDEELLEFMTGESNGALPIVLQQVGKLRNRNAHISAMSQAEYQQLYGFVLSPEEEMVKSVLGMILQLKQKIMDCSKY